MSHLSPGVLQSFIDRELNPSRQAQVQAHLEGCRSCQGQVEQMENRRQQVAQAFMALEADQPASRPAQTGHRVYARLVERIDALEQETKAMSKIRSNLRRIPTQAWAGLAVILILAAALAFPQVRAAADSFLGLFRVQRIQVVQLSNGRLPGELENSSHLESMLTQNVQVVEGGKPQPVVDAAEAAALAGFSVRLPQALDGPLDLSIQPGLKATFFLDLELARAVLQDLEREDIELPADLNGAEITVEIPTSVMAVYGRCKPGEEPQDLDAAEGRSFRCTTLVQLPSPTLTAPPGLDITRVGEAYLQLLGMSRQEAERFSRNVDWSTTFVIPIPRYGTEYRDITIEGVTGTLVQYYDEYLLLWVKDGILYALGGPGNYTTALRIAGSMK